MWRPYRMPRGMLLSIATGLALIMGSKPWELASGLPTGLWYLFGVLAAVPAWRISRGPDKPKLLGSTPTDPAFVRSGFGGWMQGVIFVPVPMLVAGVVTGLASGAGAAPLATALASTAAVVVAVVFCYRLVEALVNRRDAAAIARTPARTPAPDEPADQAAAI